MKRRFTLSAGKVVLIISLTLVFSAAAIFVSCSSEPSVQSGQGQALPETSGDTSPETSLQIEVSIEGFAFNPSVLDITVGTTVVWYNNDSVAHTVTARDESFDSGRMSEGDSFSYTFNVKGVFEYYCTLHPYMTGEITVR